MHQCLITNYTTAGTMYTCVIRSNFHRKRNKNQQTRFFLGTDLFSQKFPPFYYFPLAPRSKTGAKSAAEGLSGERGCALFARTREIALTSVIKIQSTFDIYQGPV